MIRLLETTSLQLKVFSEKQLPPYAILSHRWGPDEISFKEMMSPTASTQTKQGFLKIYQACQRAKHDRLQYIWVDTCCIDKSDELELEKALNSMFRWYQKSSVCYAYLSDVRHANHSAEFERSAWFTRGWTLQELIAPSIVQFFDVNWSMMGTKQTLDRQITRATTIDSAVLHGAPLNAFSVAQRMSWAAGRRTQKIEDTAHCLMGIFGVNMELMYGHGEKAFHRLQEKIIETLEDETVFAWRTLTRPEDQQSILASSPDAFAGCGNIQKLPPSTTKPFKLTNLGLQIQWKPIQCDPTTYLVILNGRDAQTGARAAIFLKPSRREGIYARTAHNGSMTTFVEGHDNHYGQKDRIYVQY